MATLSGPTELDDASIETDEARMRRALNHLDQAAKPAMRANGELGRRTDARSAHTHGSERPRQRFVQDGDVPVTVLSRARPRDADTGALAPNRLSTAENALATERNARLRVERSLAEATATVHDLQTKLGHAELARQEAVDRVQTDKAAAEAAAAAWRDQEQALTDQLATERAARQHAEAALEALRTTRQSRSSHGGTTPVATPSPAKPRKPKRSEPTEREPEPVKWWLPKKG